MVWLLKRVYDDKICDKMWAQERRNKKARHVCLVISFTLCPITKGASKAMNKQIAIITGVVKIEVKLLLILTTL